MIATLPFRMRAGVLLAILLLVGCVSHPGPTTDVWLRYAQGDAESHYYLSITTDARAGAVAEGSLSETGRSVGQVSRAPLTSAEVEELKRLFSRERLDIYEADAQTSGVNPGAASELVFSVVLSTEPTESPAPRAVWLRFAQALPMSEQTRVLIERLNALLLATWSRGQKDGPNPGIPDPELIDLH
jgi:hypothetical protein